MKTVEINFSVKGSCTTTIQVPDGFNFPTSKPEEIWELLSEKYPNHFEGFESLTEFDGFYGFTDGEMEIDNLVFEGAAVVLITNEARSEIVYQ